MAKKRIYLPNDCYIPELSVVPSNWLQKGASTKQDWYIYYYFHDPKIKEKKYKYGKLVSIRGMNYEKNLERRRIQTKAIIKDEIEDLKNGYNPITGKTTETTKPSNFIKSLWDASDKIKVVPNYREGIKSVIRGVEKAAKELDTNNLPVAQITRKYIKAILEKCSERKRWSARTHNYYRTALFILFKELVRSEDVDINPVRDVEIQKETRKERIELTQEERTKIVQHLKETDYPFLRAIQIFFHSGAREIELMNVQGKDVDLKNQTCKYTVRKGSVIREIRRPIKDIALPLWKEILLKCKPDDYLFGKGLLPGERIRAEQFGRRWKRLKKKLNITAGLYSLKHSNTSEMMDQLQDEKEMIKLTGHENEALIISIYDTKNKVRKDDKVKKVWNEF